jgi:arylsulfatase A-like enzyme
MTERRIDRRTFLKGSLLAGGLLAGGGAAIAELTKSEAPPPPARRPPHKPIPSSQPAPAAAAASPRRAVGARGPNILVILVDQLRTPQGFTAAPAVARLTPSISRLRREGVSFEHHYTASNDCTPARSALLTGLYTHQTGCMITGGSTLSPGFPTWGHLLRELGYQSWWFGKWHLTHGDNHWSVLRDSAALERYGFAGGTYPSPDGGPGQGFRVDPQITAQFEEWFAQEADGGPWCTTVSLVNPHDIAWWWRWSERIPAEAYAPARVHELPANFETPEMLEAHRKPLLQRSLQQTSAASFGPVPFTGPDVRAEWLPFLDLYLKLQRVVDGHVGRILRTLESRPDVAANTVVVFTSDHGEYGAAHGLRGKGAGAYEEAIRVPLIVRDPRARRMAARARPRRQLSSSVDVLPLLLSIATESGDWRRDPYYGHLAGRADLASILTNPTAPGRRYALHATDEIVTEFAIEPYAANAPLHVVALRTANAKYVTYSNWRPGGTVAETRGQEHELYDYGSPAGRAELHNAADHSRLEPGLHALLARAIREELRAPLPGHLLHAHRAGLENYLLTATKAARSATASRLRRGEAEDGPLSPFGGGRPGAYAQRHEQLRPAHTRPARGPGRPGEGPVLPGAGPGRLGDGHGRRGP